MHLQAKKPQGLAVTIRRPRRGQEGFSPGVLREQGPADILNLNLWPPELKDNKFVFFFKPSLWHIVTADFGH